MLTKKITEKGKQKDAVSRMLTCKVGFKQNVGHLGKSLVTMGVHGNCRTMKIMWRRPYEAFWDRLASKIKQFGVEIMAGDFNLSLTRVVPELRSRGLEVDCIAWYPWFHRADHLFGQRLGFDSCGFFYIGGMVQVKLQWSLKELDILTMVFDNDDAADDRWGLDWYSGTNFPGQPWKCYRSVRYEEADGEKDLRARLTEFLTPSTLQEDLDQIPKRDGRPYCPYLRFSQKTMNLEEWLVPQADGAALVHNGAHFPICVFTNNSRSRSKRAQQERAARIRCMPHGQLRPPLRSKSREKVAQQARASEDNRSHGDTNNRSRGQQPHYGAYVDQCVQGGGHGSSPKWSGSWQGWGGQGWRNDDWKSTPQTQGW